jgi:hypothetical protein
MGIRKLLAPMIVLTVTVAGLVAQERVPVFIKGAGADAGFTDPSKDRQDSVRDLTKRLEKSHVVRVVTNESDATTVIEVLDRATTLEMNLLGPQNKSSLSVRLKVGDYSTEFNGAAGSRGVITGYGAAASKIANQVESWVTANRERLASVKH